MTPYASAQQRDLVQFGGVNVPYKLNVPGSTSAVVPVTHASGSGKLTEHDKPSGPSAVAWAPTHKAPLTE